jgi:hypothetical protein
MLGMVVAAAIEGLSGALQRALLRQKLLLAAAAIALIALVYFSIAADLALVPRLGPAGAAAATGVILLVIAGILASIAGSLRSGRARVSTLALAGALQTEMRALAKPAVIAALIAGFAFAQRSRGSDSKE